MQTIAWTDDVAAELGHWDGSDFTNAVPVAPGKLLVRGDTPLNLKDYKIGGLSKLLGTLKMDEHIVVHVDLTFGPPSGAASPS